MKRAMILFAKGFPYNVSEPFLEAEYPLYKAYFDRVVVITGCKRGEKPTRKVCDPEIEIINDYTLSKDFVSILQALPVTLADSMFYREIGGLIRSHRFTLKRFGQLVAVSLCGNHRALLARKWMKQNPEYQVNVVYSYWLQITAYAAVRLKKIAGIPKVFTISRTHRFDLYEERMKTNYLPFQEQIVNQLNEIASISLDGKNYLERKYGADQQISICRLGAQDRNKTNPLVCRETLKIVSCSRVVPIKRIDRILETLKAIKDFSIEWTHIGGGDLLEDIKKKAEVLPANIKVNFTGTVANEDVYDIYTSTPFHIFVNVSKSEGVPVSIMEAMSFSIPVIATAVGGTAELVDEGKNGFLLKEDFTTDELYERLLDIYNMSDELYWSFRCKAREKFKSDYDAKANYTQFVRELAEKGGKVS